MLTEGQIKTMWDEFQKLGARALALSHYELSKWDDIEYFPADLWREFLMLPEVDEYIRQETAMLQSIELRKLLSNIGSSNSVGRAQLLTQLQKIVDGDTAKSGPRYIYTYIPLNDAQMHATNVVIEEKDVFWRA